MDKQYDPKQVEAKWYACWQERGYFRLPSRADHPGRPAYCLTIPPPNVTGSLHMGHALQHSIHDCLARWRRMCGDRVLVVPGTDHAAISTNMKVEQLLAEEGVSRHDLGREQFLERCWEWTRKYGGEIIEQLKALGCSYDWDRTRFTLDDDYYRAVQQAFVHFHQRGWLYRGHRVVNWCPACASTVSDLEVQHADQEGKLWHILYPFVAGEGGVIVATTRPETMLGDTAVAVNSQDPRYTHLHGKTVRLPLMNRDLPIICDDVLVDPKFGTGAVKVTPAHDLNDFEAGERNGLPSVVVIGEDACMTEEAGAYAGLDRYDARARVVADLDSQGLLVKIEDYNYNVGRHDRCQTVLEPLLSEQWFVRMSELARLALEVIEDGKVQVKYVPDRFRGYTIEWLRNLRDWNISRQIWWGHRIPAYLCQQCDEIIVQLDAPAACPSCGGPVEQDQDTLDTWFSSALWPFAVLGWPDETELKRSYNEGIYPASLMITARDILYLWIVRMIMTSLEFTGDLPFREVLVHATVLNLEGRRMSKSLGTGVDPLDLIADYGADATRFSLLFQCATDQDIRFGEERTELARNFCNKIWNASRFVLMNLGEDFVPDPKLAATVKVAGSLAERWILSRYGAMLETVEQALRDYDMAEAARGIHTFFWSEFCDWFVELCKPVLQREGAEADRARQTLWFVLEGTLRALHPFMPFISEEIWQQLPGAGESIMIASWPTADPDWHDEEAEREMEAVMQVISIVRKQRSDHQVPPSERVIIAVHAGSRTLVDVLQREQAAILFLARGSGLEFPPPLAYPPELAGMAVSFVWQGAQHHVLISSVASPQELQKRLESLVKEKQSKYGEFIKIGAEILDPGFRAGAPEAIQLKKRAHHDKLGREVIDLDQRIRAAQAALKKAEQSNDGP